MNDLREINNAMKSVVKLNAPPWTYRLASNMIQKSIPGGYLLFNALAASGSFNCVVDFPLNSSVQIATPLFTDNRWSENLLQCYERELISLLIEECDSIRQPLRLVDCGASFGLFAMHLAIASKFICEVHAIEPNLHMCDILRTNCSRLNIPAFVKNCAVSDWAGRGELRSPKYDSSPDAMYLEKSDCGSIEVKRVDDLVLAQGGGILLKIDVEGGESQVIGGAAKLLRQADEFIVAIEAHPKVCSRTGVDPILCLRMLCEISECDFKVAEEPALQIDLTVPFFDQIEANKVYNIICRSRCG